MNPVERQGDDETGQVSLGQLAPGTQLGPYRIEAVLGAGGMGEVYRAHDVRLNRELAIKVLAQGKARDREALDRFQQEARSASALNHPNIITIYDIGQFFCGQEPISYIAMEFVDGLSLRQLVSDGRPPIKQVLDIAVQAADALAAAHAKGIVHRDLKPENVMVSRPASGQPGLVKILDFGLAKLEIHGPTGDSRATLTLSPETRPGMILGTIGYMSPEQASGHAADFRSDQFSLGSILYEMATGKRAFRRSTGVETLVAIIREEPESISQLNSDIPPPLQWAIQRCLAKNPDHRYASTRDLARDLAIVRDHFGDAPAATRAAHPHNLPTQRTPLIGREGVLATAKQLLLREDVRLVTLTGAGGTGKTRLALQVAEDLLERFEGGVYFVPLASITDPGLVGPTIAHTLGVRQAGSKPLSADLKEHLQQEHRLPTLLLLDNFEQVTSAAPQVAELLEASAGLKILVTSRALLHVYGEHEFPVSPLPLPDLKLQPDVETLSQNPAVALFLQRAVALKPDLVPTPENVRAVAEICARLDGLPLAIELAAARIKLLPPAAMLTRLQSRLQLLTGGARDLPERQQTLRAAVGWSYELLNAAEQKLFRRLAVFVSGCTLEAAEAVCNAANDLEIDPLDGIASLADKSLLRQYEPPDGEARFRMLETIREFALERLAASGEEEATRRAHAAYCLVLAEEGGPEFGGPERQAWFNRFDLEQDNFRTALEWLTRTRNTDWGLRLGVALQLYWRDYARPAEGRDWLWTLLHQPGAAARNKLRASALSVSATLSTQHGDHDFSLAVLKDCLELYRELGDKPGTAATLIHEAVVRAAQGDHSAARSLFVEAIRLWEEAGDQMSAARTMSNLADVVRAQGDYAAARSLHQECMVIFRSLGDRAGMAWSLNHQGDVVREEGDTAAARALYEQALMTFRELGDRMGIARSLTDLAVLAGDEGSHAAAQLLYGEALQLFWALGETRQVAQVLENIACTAADQKNWEGALRIAGAAASLRQRSGYPSPPASRARLEHSLEPARQRLTTNAAATAWMAGSRMTPEQVIEYASLRGAA